MKEPELAIREEDSKEDELVIPNKEESLDNISERENVENESKSVKLGAINKDAGSAISQQQPSIEQNVQVIDIT